MSGTRVYGARERADLAALADRITAVQPEVFSKASPVIADRLRKALPDMDDVSIGRVLVALTDDLGPMFLSDTPLPVLWASLAGAGLQMTEAEWKDVTL